MDKLTGNADLGRDLRALRMKAGLTQAQLADRLGIVRTQVSRIETGARSTELDVVEQWYRECGYSLQAVEVGTPAQANTLALAAVAIPKDQIDSVLAVLTAWPRLSERARGRILGIIESD